MSPARQRPLGRGRGPALRRASARTCARQGVGVEAVVARRSSPPRRPRRSSIVDREWLPQLDRPGRCVEKGAMRIGRLGQAHGPMADFGDDAHRRHRASPAPSGSWRRSTGRGIRRASSPSLSAAARANAWPRVATSRRPARNRAGSVPWKPKIACLKSPTMNSVRTALARLRSAAEIFLGQRLDDRPLVGGWCLAIRRPGYGRCAGRA